MFSQDNFHFPKMNLVFQVKSCFDLVSKFSHVFLVIGTEKTLKTGCYFRAIACTKVAGLDVVSAVTCPS